MCKHHHLKTVPFNVTNMIFGITWCAKILTGQEPELQPKSWKKFFCTTCKPTGKGKGHGKSSTVSVNAQQNIENLESQDDTCTQSMTGCGGCSRG